MFDHFADFFSILFVYYIMFVYFHDQNNVPHKATKGFLGTCTSIYFLWIEKIGCCPFGCCPFGWGPLAAYFKLNMEKDFYTIDTFKFSTCLLLFKEVVFQYVRLLH